MIDTRLPVYAPADPNNLKPLNALVQEGVPVPGVQIPKSAQWPSVRVNRRGQAAESGPTGAPWVNANGWLIRTLQAANPNQPIWLPTKPPQSAPPESHALAVADAMAYGAKWIVTHNADTWPAVKAAIEFFESHKSWHDQTPVSNLAVAADFSHPDPFRDEYLNLLTRRQICFSLHAPNQIPETPALAWFPKTPPPKSNLLIKPADHPDPYTAAAKTHLALTRKLDLLRTWNAGSINTLYTQSPDKKQSVVHMVNYSAREASHHTTLWLAKNYKSAKLLTFTVQENLKPQPVNGGIELALPPLGVYTAILLEA